MRLMINDQGGEGRNLAFNTEADRQFSSKFYIKNTAAVILTLKLVRLPFRYSLQRGGSQANISTVGWLEKKAVASGLR